MKSRCPHVRHAIQEHGWDNFVVKVLMQTADMSEAKRLEETLIAQHNTLSPCGYNLNSGGYYRLQHEETKQKLSFANTGKTISQVTRDKISVANKGKRLSEATKLKCSIAKKGRPGTARSLETRHKMSIAHQKHNPHNKPVIITFAGGNTMIFPSIKTAHLFLNVGKTTLCRILHGKRSKQPFTASFIT